MDLSTDLGFWCFRFVRSRFGVPRVLRATVAVAGFRSTFRVSDWTSGAAVQSLRRWWLFDLAELAARKGLHRWPIRELRGWAGSGVFGRPERITELGCSR